MLIKRFGFAKSTEGEISTPTLLITGKDIKIEERKFIFRDRNIEVEINYPPSIEQREIKIGENIYLIPNISTLLKNTRELVDYTINIRRKLGFDKLFYAPGVPPHLIPIFFYLGYDIFDNSREMLDNYSLIGKVNDGEREFSSLIMRETIRAFNEGRLRELVESIADNKAKEILRHLDLEYYEEQEKFWPIWNKELNAITLDSLFRPDVHRWMQRLMERYEKPKYARYLLFLPCSAKKPYSISKSHREMKRYIKSTMHEVILTSPLTLVPRELEAFYPAQNYDIPVVGHWYEEEKKMIRDMVVWYLEKFLYDGIISYLPESMRFLEDVFKEYGVEAIWGNDLEKLERVTRKIDYHVSRVEVLKDNIESLATYQFGIPWNFRDARIKGRYPRIEVWMKNTRLFGYNIEKGMLTLTEKSSQILLSKGKYVVRIDDFYPEGDVFAAGILDASSEIREGDEVVIAHGNELRAWGTARMCSYDMVHQKRGKAIKVRRKLKH